MITLLIGENSFEIERTLKNMSEAFPGVAEKLEGSALDLSQLADSLMGVSLFSESRLVVIRNLSQNRQIWPVLGDWLPKLADEIHLVLIESKLDKRALAYKALKKYAEIHEFKAWSDRDYAAAEKWLSSEADKLKLNLDKKSIQFLLQRVGNDQWALSNALQKLTLLDDISVDVISDVIESSPTENVFNILQIAIDGDAQKLSSAIKTIEANEDVYKMASLLSSQVFQLAAVMAASKADNPAKDFGIHPFVVSKLAPVANKLGKNGVAKIVSIFAELDDDMKISKAEPWLLVERALMKVSSI